MSTRILVLFIISVLLTGTSNLKAQQIPRDPDLTYSKESCTEDNIIISRSDYYEKLQGFWLGECIANWTGLTTEGARNSAPFLTDEDWGTRHGRAMGENGTGQLIQFFLVEDGDAWGADDDTDIEYIYQSILDENNVNIATAEQIRNGWLKHVKSEEENYLWVSNETALNLMIQGMLPPETSLPKNNENFDQIDAQLTTEIFGIFAPARPDIALKMSHLPIRTTAYQEAEWISEFYVIMHSLASRVDSTLNKQQQVMWLAEQARVRLPDASYPAKIYDFIQREYENNPDKQDWEQTRDRFNGRHEDVTTDGYQTRNWYDAGINFGASLISLFYGEGDFKRTVKIGTLCGWDSDNPTATWGGLLGFMLGRKGVEQAFPDKALSGQYLIARTRINFPDRIQGQPGDDTFELMALRGIHIIDRVIIEEIGGGIDLEKDVWCIPNARSAIQPASLSP